MYPGGTVDNSFVVTEHLAPGKHRNTEISEGVAQVNDLLDTCACSHEFRAIGGGFNRGLLLGIPVNRCAIE